MNKIITVFSCLVVGVIVGIATYQEIYTNDVPTDINVIGEQKIKNSFDSSVDHESSINSLSVDSIEAELPDNEEVASLIFDDVSTVSEIQGEISWSN